METQLQEIREQQRASWNKFSPGWDKWDTVLMNFLQPMGDEIIRQINPKDGEQILDIAAGTGEPGLTIASMISNGKVVITDLAEDMLEIAKAHANKKNIKNIELKACDVCELPFADNTFDAISCRFGFMFFPDMQLAAKEMFRVLKPGGRIATSVWDIAEKNFWVTVMGGTINKHMQLPSPPPNAPGMFRCAQPGLMSTIFNDAGFHHISEKLVPGVMNSGSADNYWNMTVDIAAPFAAALGKADEVTKANIKSEVYNLLNERFPDDKVAISCSAIVVYGEK